MLLAASADGYEHRRVAANVCPSKVSLAFKVRGDTINLSALPTPRSSSVTVVTVAKQVYNLLNNLSIWQPTYVFTEKGFEQRQK